MNHMRPFHKSLKNKSGQGTIEYILILLIAISCATLLSKSIQGFWQSGVTKMGGRLEQSIKTGRLPQRAWRE